MVLSPIEPVAPSTVTERTVLAAALLLRKGTALMTSPNHKTAADAIRATPQKTKNRRHDDGRHEAVKTIEQAAVPGNDVAGVLDAEPAFHGRFKEIAKLGNDRKGRAQQQRVAGFERERRIGPLGYNCKKSRGDRKASDKAADRTRPGLVGTDPRPEFRSADAAARKVAADIGYPDHQQNKEQRDKSTFVVEAHQHRCNLGSGGIGKSRRRPTPRRLRKQDDT